jgi:hypothetical protein
MEGFFNNANASATLRDPVLRYLEELQQKCQANARLGTEALICLGYPQFKV